MDIAFELGNSERNRQERGFGFAYAARVFAGHPAISAAKIVDGGFA